APVETVHGPANVCRQLGFIDVAPPRATHFDEQPALDLGGAAGERLACGERRLVTGDVDRHARPSLAGFREQIAEQLLERRLDPQRALQIEIRAKRLGAIATRAPYGSDEDVL